MNTTTLESQIQPPESWAAPVPAGAVSAGAKRRRHAAGSPVRSLPAPETVFAEPREMVRLAGYRVIGRCAIPAFEFEKIVEAHAIHGLTPRQMRKMGLTRLSEYYINKCIVSTGIARASDGPPPGIRCTLDVVAGMDRRLQVIEETLRRIARQLGVPAS